MHSTPWTIWVTIARKLVIGGLSSVVTPAAAIGRRTGVILQVTGKRDNAPRVSRSAMQEKKGAKRNSSPLTRYQRQVTDA